MKIIVPMAGRGSRLRPHTLTVPKPLIHVAGKPIVHRLVEDIAEMCDDKIEEISQEYLQNPIRISIPDDKLILTNIDHNVVLYIHF